MSDSAVCPKCKNPMARMEGFAMVDGKGTPTERRQRCFACDPPKLKPVSEHSPAPWFVHPLFQTSVMNKEGDVAEASPSNPRRFHDARLIAAALDLLAVAERAAGMPCLCAASYSDVPEVKDPADDCYACAARALIARIDGAPTPTAEPAR
jgi:hypothetical protein